MPFAVSSGSKTLLILSLANYLFSFCSKGGQREREREINLPSTGSSLSKCLQQLRLGQAWTRMLELKAGLPHGLQGRKNLSCHYCLPGCTLAGIELGKKLGLEPRHSYLRCKHLKQGLNSCAKNPPLCFIFQSAHLYDLDSIISLLQEKINWDWWRSMPCPKSLRPCVMELGLETWLSGFRALALSY